MLTTFRSLYAHNKWPLDKNRSSKCCQSGVKQTLSKTEEKKKATFLYHGGTLNRIMQITGNWEFISSVFMKSDYLKSFHFLGLLNCVVAENIHTPTEGICHITPLPSGFSEIGPKIYPPSPPEFPKVSYTPWKYCYLLLKGTDK